MVIGEECGLDLEALVLEFVVLDELVGAAVVGVSFVHDVLADLLEGLGDVEVQVEEFLHNLLVDLVVLIVHLLLTDEVQVVRQVLHVPRVLLNFLKSYPLHRVRLQHPVYKVLHLVRNVVRDEVAALFDLREELRHLVVVEGKGPADHRVQDDSTRPHVHFSPAVAHARDYLWRCVVGRPTRSFKGYAIAHDVSQPEVNQADIQILVQK